MFCMPVFLYQCSESVASVRMEREISSTETVLLVERLCADRWGLVSSFLRVRKAN